MADLGAYLNDKEFQSLPEEHQVDLLMQAGADDDSIVRGMQTLRRQKNFAKTPEQLRGEIASSEKASAEAEPSWLKPTSRVLGGITRAAGSLIPGAPLISEPLAQMTDVAAGDREHISLPAVAGETAFSMIPGGKIASSIEKGAGKILAPALAKRITPTVARRAEQAVIGEAASALPSVTEGKSYTPGVGAIAGPVISAGAEGAGKLVGAAGEALSRKHLNVVDNRITKALAPAGTPGAQFFQRNLREARANLYQNADKWNDMRSFAEASREATDEFYKRNHTDLTEYFQEMRVPGIHISKSIADLKNRLRPEQAGMAEQINELAEKYGNKRDFSLAELADFRSTLNAKLKNMESMEGVDRATLVKANPLAAAMDRQAKATRDLLNSTVDHIGNLVPGETKKILRTYRSMLDITQRAEELAPHIELQDAISAGTRLGPTEAAARIGRAMGFGRRPSVAVGAETLSAGTKSFNHPNNLIRSAKKVLTKGRFKVAPGERALEAPVSAQFNAPRLALPPATSEPSITDLSNIHANVTSRRRANQRLLPGQTREDFANEPAPGAPLPVTPGEMELSPGQIPRTAGDYQRPSPITLPDPTLPMQTTPPQRTPSNPRVRAQAVPTEGEPPAPVTLPPEPLPSNLPPHVTEDFFSNMTPVEPASPEKLVERRIANQLINEEYSGPERRASAPSPEEIERLREGARREKTRQIYAKIHRRGTEILGGPK